MHTEKQMKLVAAEFIIERWRGKGDETSIENCQMLCKTHNRAKGNG